MLGQPVDEYFIRWHLGEVGETRRCGLVRKNSALETGADTQRRVFSPPSLCASWPPRSSFPLPRPSTMLFLPCCGWENNNRASNHELKHLNPWAIHTASHWHLPDTKAWTHPSCILPRYESKWQVSQANQRTLSCASGNPCASLM